MNCIRFATIEDTEHIMMFIHINWKKNHILYRDKNFFLYEHQNNNKVNYCMIDTVKNDIENTLIIAKDELENRLLQTLLTIQDK